MGRGRRPCCDKARVKKGPWSQAEDSRLVSFIQHHGHANWRALPKQAGLLRCGKSCRLRWINYLRPDIKRGNFTPEELETITNLHKLLGNKWSKIASQLPGRTDNEIKNVWHTHLKKPSSIAKEHKNMTTSAVEPLKDYGFNNSTDQFITSSVVLEFKNADKQDNPKTLSQNGQEVLNQTRPLPDDQMVEPSSSSNSSSSSSSSSSSNSNSNSNSHHHAEINYTNWCTIPESNIDVIGEYNWNTPNVFEKENNIDIPFPFEPNFDFWDLSDAYWNIDS